MLHQSSAPITIAVLGANGRLGSAIAREGGRARSSHGRRHAHGEGTQRDRCWRA